MTGSRWVEAILSTPIQDRLDLVWNRPIVVWFNKNRRVVCRLIKVSGRLGSDLWMIQGRDNENNHDLDVTPGPTTLDCALRYLTLENGWVLCEFESEIEFHIAALCHLYEWSRR